MSHQGYTTSLRCTAEEGNAFSRSFELPRIFQDGLPRSNSDRSTVFIQIQRQASLEASINLNDVIRSGLHPESVVRAEIPAVPIMLDTYSVNRTLVAYLQKASFHRRVCLHTRATLNVLISIKQLVLVLIDDIREWPHHYRDYVESSPEFGTQSRAHLQELRGQAGPYYFYEVFTAIF